MLSCGSAPGYPVVHGECWHANFLCGRIAATNAPESPLLRAGKVTEIASRRVRPTGRLAGRAGRKPALPSRSRKGRFFRHVIPEVFVALIDYIPRNESLDLSELTRDSCAIPSFRPADYGRCRTWPCSVRPPRFIGIGGAIRLNRRQRRGAGIFSKCC